jgi:two-component system NtrC family sensor kinase
MVANWILILRLKLYHRMMMNKINYLFIVVQLFIILLPNTASDSVTIKHYNNLLHKSLNTQDADSIIYYSSLAAEYAKDNGQSHAIALVILGNGYLQSGNISNALNYFFKAANSYLERNNPIGLATTYTYIAETYSSQEDHNTSIKYYNRSIKIFDEEHDTSRLASAIHNLAHEFYLSGELDSALIYFDQSEALYRSIGYELGILYCFGNRGMVYAEKNELDSAEFYLIIAIKKLEELEDEYATTDFAIEYANVLSRKGNSTKALRYAKKANTLAQKNNNTEQQRDAALALSNIYEKRNDYRNAFKFQGTYYALNDSINNLETVQQMADLRTEYEVSQKQLEVDNLRRKRKFLRILVVALIVGIIVSTVLVYLYYSSLRKSKQLSKLLDKRRKELEIQRTELEELNKVKDRFFSIISHDLRGPISSLSGISVMLKESLESENYALLKEIIDFIDQTVISFSGLLENLLNWALSQQGQFPFHKKKLDTKVSIAEVVKSQATLALIKNISIQLKTEENLFIEADENTFMTIIRNLINNAIKFTNGKGLIGISSYSQNNKVIITIEDDGVGIPAEKLNSLFTLQEGKSSRGTTNEKGMGLGLHLVQEFVQMNKGEISVSSELKKGSVFTLSFPLCN